MQKNIIQQLKLERVEKTAPIFLGATLVTPVGESIIVEVEAYAGKDDPGSHGYTRITPKNRSLFGRPGTAYVYISYGVHRMLNVVAHPDGEPGAILIRACKPISGIESMQENRGVMQTKNLLSGPGKLTQALKIGMHHDQIELFNPKSEIHITNIPSKQRPYLIGTRIGLAPGKGDEIPWRFIDEELREWCSAKKLKP